MEVLMYTKLVFLRWATNKSIYDETFASVKKMTIGRMILALSIVKSWSFFQLYVKNAFSHGDRNETVYMTPLGYTVLNIAYIC